MDLLKEPSLFLWRRRRSHTQILPHQDKELPLTSQSGGNLYGPSWHREGLSLRRILGLESRVVWKEERHHRENHHLQGSSRPGRRAVRPGHLRGFLSASHLTDTDKPGRPPLLPACHCLPGTQGESEPATHGGRCTGPATELKPYHYFSLKMIPVSKFLCCLIFLNDPKVCDAVPVWTLCKSEQLLQTRTRVGGGVFPKIPSFVKHVRSLSCLSAAFH